MVTDRPSSIGVLAMNPSSFRAFVMSATLRAMSPLRGGKNFNPDCVWMILCIVFASSRIVVSFPEAMLKTLLCGVFSSRAIVASTTSETQEVASLRSVSKDVTLDPKGAENPLWGFMVDLSTGALLLSSARPVSVP